MAVLEEQHAGEGGAEKSPEDDGPGQKDVPPSKGRNHDAERAAADVGDPKDVGPGEKSAPGSEKEDPKGASKDGVSAVLSPGASSASVDPRVRGAQKQDAVESSSGGEDGPDAVGVDNEDAARAAAAAEGDRKDAGPGVKSALGSEKEDPKRTNTAALFRGTGGLNARDKDVKSSGGAEDGPGEVSAHGLTNMDRDAELVGAHGADTDDELLGGDANTQAERAEGEEEPGNAAASGSNGGGVGAVALLVAGGLGAALMAYAAAGAAFQHPGRLQLGHVTDERHLPRPDGDFWAHQQRGGMGPAYTRHFPEHPLPRVVPAPPPHLGGRGPWQHTPRAGTSTAIPGATQLDRRVDAPGDALQAAQVLDGLLFYVLAMVLVIAAAALVLLQDQ